MKYRHYAPSAPLELIDGDPKSAADYILKNNLSRIAIISYDEDVAFFREKVQHAAIYSFGSRFDETEQAHLLFSLLRLADKENYEKIYAPLPGKSGVGLALFNRMIRAAAYTIVKV